MDVRRSKSNPTAGLTPREIEVLLLVMDGKSSKEVAAQLYISRRTVEYHLASVYGKLEVNNRMQAFHRALSLGLVSQQLFVYA